MAGRADLYQKLRDYTNRENIPEVKMDTWINAAELYLNANLRCREMIKHADITYGADYGDLPSNYEMFNIVRYKTNTLSDNPRIRNGRPLRYYATDAYYDRSSMPYMDKGPSFTIDGFRFLADGAVAGVVFTMSYFASLTTLGASTDNEIWPKYPSLYIFAALAESGKYLEDIENVPMWEKSRDEIIAARNEATRSGQYGQAPLRRRVRSFG